MTNATVIVGAAGFGRETADVVEANGGQVHGIIDDNPSPENLERLAAREITYLGTLDDWLATDPEPMTYLIGIGAGLVKEKISTRLDAAGHHAGVAVHPSATIGSSAKIGSGAVICAGVRMTTNITLGRHVHLNLNVTVGHDSHLHDFSSVNPTANISGDCTIGARALVGVAATVLQGLSIGADSVVGGSSLVTKDVPDSVVVKGIPGKW